MTPWVLRLVVANVVMYGLQHLYPQLTGMLEFVPALAAERPWTFLTYAFLHASIAHILFNMLALYWFGPRVEERLGGGHFMTLYGISAIGGAVCSFAMPTTAVIGASGAIMGVLVAFAKYWPRERLYIWGVIPVQAWMIVVIYVLLDLGGVGGLGGAGIAHLAHLGGVGSGYLYLRWLEFRSPARAWKRKVATPAATPRILGATESLRRWRGIPVDTLHSVNRDEIVRLLAKIEAEGQASLTPEERATLNRFSVAPPPTG
jgi:membrane associated rhomboid family serine protease